MSVIYFNNDFSKGFAAAKQEISSGDIYCIESAIMQFVSDPPDSEFQRKGAQNEWGNIGRV